MPTNSTTNIEHSYIESFLNILSQIKRSLYSIVLTSECYVNSIYVLITMFSLIIYFYTTMDKTDFSFLNFENTDKHFFFLFWLINIIVIICTWNLFLYFYLTVCKYKYIPNIGNTFLSRSESLYGDPFFFMLMILQLDSQVIYNLIDISFLITISSVYYFMIFNIVNFYINFDKEIDKALNKGDSHSNKTTLLSKMKTIGKLFFVVNMLFSGYVYFICFNISNNYVKYILLGKGGYVFLKINELYFTRKFKLHYGQLPMKEKERCFVSELKSKTFLELITMGYVYCQFKCVLINKKSQSFYFSFMFFTFILSQVYNGVIYYRNYEHLKEYFRYLDETLSRKQINNKQRCYICNSLLDEGRELSCGHVFHLICIGKYCDKGYEYCPICNGGDNYKEINSNNHHNMGNNNNSNEMVLSLKLSNCFFNLFPDINIRITTIPINQSSMHHDS